MVESRKVYLIKNTLIFTLGNIGTKLITFFLIPLYTNVLTTSQYGIVDLIATVSTVAGPVLTLNICESVMRFGLDRDADRNKNIQIGTFVFGISALIGLIIIPICCEIEYISAYSVYVYLYIFSLVASQLYMCDLRGKELLLQYSIGNILQTFLVALFNIYFLLFLELETKGYLLAYIISNFATACYALVVGKGYRSFFCGRLDWKKAKEMASYSVTLIPNTFMWWIMNSSDRIMVTSMLGAAANGIYAVSYKLPTLVSVLIGIFNQAWSYSAIREEGADDEENYYNEIFKALISVTIFVGMGLLAIIKPLLKVYVAADYYEAWKYTPFLIIGCVYLSLGTFMATSYTVHKDSLGFLLSATFGAVFNVVLNFFLIPIIEIYGAVVATCISYILVFLFRLIHTQKYIKYNILNKEFLVGSILMISSAAFMFLDNLIGHVCQLLLLLIAVFIYANVWKPFMLRIKSIAKRGKEGCYKKSH